MIERDRDLLDAAKCKESAKAEVGRLNYISIAEA